MIEWFNRYVRYRVGEGYSLRVAGWTDREIAYAAAIHLAKYGHDLMMQATV